MNYYTENLNEVLATAKNRNKVRDLLDAWDKKGLPDDFYDQGSRLAFNRDSENVFIVNDDNQTAMLNGDILESYYVMPYDGHEGFLDNLIEALNASWHTTDVGSLIRLVNDVGTDAQKAAFLAGKLTDDTLDFESYYELLAVDGQGNRYVSVDDEPMSIVNGAVTFGSEAFFNNTSCVIWQ